VSVVMMALKNTSECFFLGAQLLLQNPDVNEI